MLPEENIADKAMGIELEAIEMADQLEWAEAQGRADDAARLRVELDRKWAELAALCDPAA